MKITKNAAFATVCFVAIAQRNGKKRIQKMGIKSFRYIESKIGDPLFQAVVLHESKVFIQ